MSKRVDVLSSARNVLAGVFGVLGCVLRFGWMLLLPKAVLGASSLQQRASSPLASMPSGDSERIRDLIANHLP